MIMSVGGVANDYRFFQVVGNIQSDWKSTTTTGADVVGDNVITVDSYNGLLVDYPLSAYEPFEDFLSPEPLELKRLMNIEHEQGTHIEQMARRTRQDAVITRRLGLKHKTPHINRKIMR